MKDDKNKDQKKKEEEKKDESTKDKKQSKPEKLVSKYYITNQILIIIVRRRFRI